MINDDLCHYKSSRFIGIAPADYPDVGPGPIRNASCPISDSLFVSHCKNAYEIGIF